MRTFIALFCTLSVFTARGGEIEPGTHLLLRLDHTISTKTATAGDAVHLRTATPTATIPAGSYVRGVINRSKRPGRVRGRGGIEIGIVSIMRPDGTVLPVTASFSSKETPPLRRAASPPFHFLAPTLPFMGGYGAGAAAAALTARTSQSVETIAGVGLAVGVTTVVLIHVLARGPDLELRQGTAIDVVF
jgi:hypothetical protein